MLLLNHGTLLEDHIRRAGLTDDLVLQAIREHGFASAADVQMAVLEVDGTISIVPTGTPPCARGTACVPCAPEETSRWQLPPPPASAVTAPGSRTTGSASRRARTTARSRPSRSRARFRPAERALAWVDPRRRGPASLRALRLRPQPHEDALGKGRRITLTSVLPRRGVSPATRGRAVRRASVLRDARRRHERTRRRRCPCAGAARLRHAGGTARSPAAGVEPVRSPHLAQRLAVLVADDCRSAATQHDVRSAPAGPRAGAAAVPNPAASPRTTSAVMYDPASGRSLLAGCVTARDFVTQVLVDAPGRLDRRALPRGRRRRRAR